jgi:hypothetical protein
LTEFNAAVSLAIQFWTSCKLFRFGFRGSRTCYTRKYLCMRVCMHGRESRFKVYFASRQQQPLFSTSVNLSERAIIKTENPHNRDESDLTVCEAMV